jgi:hypothetical protein
MSCGRLTAPPVAARPRLVPHLDTDDWILTHPVLPFGMHDSWLGMSQAALGACASRLGWTFDRKDGA